MLEGSKKKVGRFKKRAWEDSSFKYKEEGQSGAEKNMDK